eukprot:gene3567-7936_t
MRRYAGTMQAIVVQPTAGPGNPPSSSWPGWVYCADRVLLGLDDVEATFNVDTTRIYS